MDPYRREDGTWMVPSTYRDPERDITATGYTELTPDHPQYQEWRQWLDAEQPDWAQTVAGRMPR
jgi:hypothetical protein